MRDLKFRGWNENKNGWVEFFDLHIKAESPLNILDLTGMSGIVLEQFTGLNDKNGKEIYEGDIVTDHSMDSIFNDRQYNDQWWRGVVSIGLFSIIGGISGHGEGNSYTSVIGWFYETISTDNFGVNSKKSKPLSDKIVVIGNIHQNPELLK